MTARARILDTARRLAIDTGSVPSMDVIASAAGVSKGGFTHHFGTRAALLAGLAEQAIESMDQALDAAVATGGVVRTWLEVSMSREEADLYRALLMSLNEGGADTSELLRRSAEASTRWERLLAEELGDPVAGSVVRLLGDGLVMNTLTGDALPSLEAVLGWLDAKQHTR
ncbi:TetR/AcrR family transcriptional regulator [Arthrobacter sp. B0490]|uniref:TetR/AcrR family transcriptional regulator n=1 Tax=Arthrobacter sp. B0490 TaxID=2058891 RepID=UPI000CE435C9|nr:TetR/AcrR family transcriptional regulator [Arthrobacter sp. B0490]